MNPDEMNALAALLRALAWPLVAVVVMWVFKPELRVLLGRFRRGAGLEFDPPAKQPEAVAPRTPAAALAGDLQLSPSAAAVVAQIQTIPEFRTADSARRINLLLHATAWLVTIAQFADADGAIWGSQLGLLEHLNAVGADTPANLKARFYDPAAARFPPMFANYPFQSYLSWLQGSQLVEPVGESVQITQLGRDYLAWRVWARRAPKPMG